MRYRRLGKTSLTVSALGLGCAPMSRHKAPIDDGESVATIHRALDLGVTFFDTSDVYGAGHNETIVGRHLDLSGHPGGFGPRHRPAGGCSGGHGGKLYQAVQSGAELSLRPGRTPGRMFGVLRSSATRTALRPVIEPPFHAIRLCASITYTMGGIAIDDQARVLADSGAPIAGLYAVGSYTGGLEGGPMAGYIGGLCKAVSLGFIAANSIAAMATPAHAEI